MRLGYLVSQYPAASVTFIRREVLGMRALGHVIETFSVRRTDGLSRLAAKDQEEAKNTWYAQPPEPLRLARAHVATAAARPKAYLSTLRLALRHRAPGLKGAIWGAFHFVESMDLAAELKKRGIDHVHNHFGNSGATVGYLATHYLKIGWSLTVHGTSEFDYPAGLLLAEKMEAARAVVCVSHFGRAQAMRMVDPKHWNKFHLVRAGIDPPREITTPPRSTRPRLVCVARLSPEKGHAGLLRAFAHVVSEGLDVELELVGGGPERARIEGEIQRLGLADRVTLRGQVGEVEALTATAGATVFVLASFMEGLPVVLMEALALGVPVIAPCVAGIPELVEHGVSGLTFPPGDWDSLARAMRQMLEDPELQRRSAQEGRRRVEQQFFLTNSLPPLAEVFEEITGNRPRAAQVQAQPRLPQVNTGRNATAHQDGAPSGRAL